MVVAPMVPIKGYLVRQSKAEAAAAGAVEESPPKRSDAEGAMQLAKLACVGVFAGVASGMFGIGAPPPASVASPL